MTRKTNVIIVLALLLFSLVYAVTRFPRLNNDIVSTDSVYWHGRSERFLEGILTQDYLLTFQKYHPGVTLMWEMALTAQVVSIYEKVPYTQVFVDFERIEYLTKITIVVWQFVLSLGLIWVLGKALRNFWLGYFSVLLFNLEPFYVGNSRLIHHDAQISLYVMLGLGLSYLFYADLQNRKFSLVKLICSAFFLALAALSKTLFIGAFIFVLGFIGLLLLKNKDFRLFLKFVVLFVLAYVLFYIGFFPALWVDLVGVLRQIIFESYDTSESGGHAQIMFGVETHNPGPIFYILLLLTKLSLVGLVGVLIFKLNVIFSIFKTKNWFSNLFSNELSFVSYSAIFYIGYFVVICVFDKKVDRYVISLFPFISLAAVLGWESLFQKFSKSTQRIGVTVVVTLLASYSIIYPLFSIFPHYLAYVNPIFGNANTSNKMIGQKLFGIGIFDLRAKIVEKFGENTSVGMNDIGPLTSIYPKGRVYNILAEHPNSYKVLVLGPNKELPKNLREDKNIKFKKVDSVYINGLEFWRIYKRI